MSRVITFSVKYPSYHKRKGEATYFVEKIVKGLHFLKLPIEDQNPSFDEEMYHIIEPKFTTIRSGNRWKVGDKFSPRAWSGRPYASKQITFAPDIEIKKVWDFEIDIDEGLPSVYINGLLKQDLDELAKNDGLTVEDLKAWFKWPTPFSGQIVCWGKTINY